MISVNKATGNSNEKLQATEKRKERSQDSQDNTKKQSMDSSSKDKHQKEKKPRQTSILRTIIKLLRVTMAALKKDLVKWKVKLFSLRKLNSVCKLK